VEGQSAFVGWPFSFFLGLNINKQQATSGKTPGPVPDRAGPKDQEQAGKGPRAKDQEQTSTCAYKIYSI